MAVKVIRKSLHDPASFELDDATFMPNGAGCYTYRAKNGFGALRVLRAVLTPERMLVTADQPAKLFAPVWNEYCAERSGEALTAYIRQNVL